MMFTKTAIVCRATKRVASADLVTKGRMHIDMLSGNPAFPELQSALPPLAAACDKLDAADQVYVFNKGRSDLIGRDFAHQEVVRLIGLLAANVQGMSRGDHELVNSTGFAIKRKRQPSQIPAAPGKLRTRYSPFLGCVELLWAAVKYRFAYQVWINMGDTNNARDWHVIATTTKNHFLVTDLPERNCSFRIVALGVLGDSPSSNVITAKAA